MNDVIDTDIERTIEGVEHLYRSLTGATPPSNGEAQRSAIPPEADPYSYVNAQLDRLIQLLDPRVVQPAPRFMPPASLFEAPDEYLVCIDLPGVPSDAVRVSIVGSAQGRCLLVTATRPEPSADWRGAPEHPRRDEQRLRYFSRWRETPAGALERLIPLPHDAAAEQANIEAESKDGCLIVRIRRSAVHVAVGPRSPTRGE